MPGKDYGPGGSWIYHRAKRLQKKNPDMSESQSFAIATQQAHKVGKSPKSFRTAQGVREAKAKFDRPKQEYQKTASLGKTLARSFAEHPVASAVGAGLGAGTGTYLAVTRLAPGAKKRREQIKKEHRDPRLWSNLKGMVTGKSREERVAAHKHLGKADGTILGAMKAGFGGKKSESEKTAGLLVPAVAASTLAGIVLANQLAKKQKGKALERPKTAEAIPGGKASGKPDSAYPADQLRMGIEVEKEHTDDPQKAKEIAKDHLEEHPRYYSALKKMEARLEKEKRANGEEEGTPGKLIPKKTLEAFFKQNPRPSDDQVHDLAEAHGASPHTTEAQIYAMLGRRMREEEKTAQLAGFFDEMEKESSITGKALKFLAGYLIAKKVFGLGQGKKKMSDAEMVAMRKGMEIGAQSVVPAAAGGITRSMQSEIAPFERQMSRIEMDLQKHAAMGMDLRLKGPGGVKRPPFPTEGAKTHAFKKLQQSQKIGQTASIKPPKPAIRSVASMPR